MKLVVGSLLLTVCAVFVPAQEAPKAAQQAEEVKAKIIAELATAMHTTQVKNSPFTADEVNESVQTLFDGNRIVRSSTGKIYRNSEGRIRRESTGGMGGVLGSTYTLSPGVSIANPMMGQKIILDEKLKTAQAIEFRSGQGLSVVTSPTLSAEEKAKLEEKLKTELKAARPLTVTGEGPVAIAGSAIGIGQGGGLAYTVGGLNSKYETRTEELGTRDFEGVSAEGTRRITTIPAGAIGNERPIEIVYERWFSKDLGMVVYSKNSDPRFGEQTYKLTNLVRTEPDPSLFVVPQGYKTYTNPTVYKTAGDAGTVYRISAKAEAEKAATAKAAASPAPAPKPKP